MPVKPGTNLLHAVANDASGNAGKETRAVVAGPMDSLSQDVPDAITATLSAQTFDAIGRGTAGFLTTGDLEAIVAPHNPVYNVGGGPDCLYAMASITSVSIGGAAVTLRPQTGGLVVDVELDNVLIGMHLQYAAACIDGSRDVTAAATHIQISGDLRSASSATTWQPLQQPERHDHRARSPARRRARRSSICCHSIPRSAGSSVGRGEVLGSRNTALAGLNNAKTIDVLHAGRRRGLAVADQLDASGAIVKLDTQMCAHGDSAGGLRVRREPGAGDGLVARLPARALR